MSCSGLAPQPSFLLSPGRPALPWEQWHRMFETCLLASGATELSPERHRAIVIHCLGTEGQRIFNTLPADAATTPTAAAEARRNWDANCTECLRPSNRGARATLRVNQQRRRRTPPIPSSIVGTKVQASLLPTFRGVAGARIILFFCF